MLEFECESKSHGKVLDIAGGGSKPSKYGCISGELCGEATELLMCLFARTDEFEIDSFVVMKRDSTGEKFRGVLASCTSSSFPAVCIE